eukprot:GEMP01000154.1.p1 GENE.GEMP01000154.1~~GEMP01000154.1.p1  ORF type:complete len:2608 (+),score=565.00 GEMP01000154.1:235-8058(+)
MSTGAQIQMPDDGRLAIEWRHRLLLEKSLRSWLLHLALLFQAQCEIAEYRIARELRACFDAWCDARVEQTVCRLRNSLAAIHGNRAILRSSFQQWTHYVAWYYHRREQVREVQYRNALKVGKRALRAWKNKIKVSHGSASSLGSSSPSDRRVVVRTPSVSSSSPLAHGDSDLPRAVSHPRPPRRAAASSCASSPLMYTRASINHDAGNAYRDDGDHLFSPTATDESAASSSCSPSLATNDHGSRERGIHTAFRDNTHLFRSRRPESAASSCSSSPKRNHCGCLRRSGGDTGSNGSHLLHMRPLPRPHALLSSTSSRASSLRQNGRLRQSRIDDSCMSSIRSVPRPHPPPSVTVSPSSSRANRHDMNSAVWGYSTSCCSSDQKLLVPLSATSSSNASPTCTQPCSHAMTDRHDFRTPSYPSRGALDAVVASSSRSWERLVFDPVSPMKPRHLLPSPRVDAFIFTTAETIIPTHQLLAASDNSKAVTISISHSDAQHQGRFPDNLKPAVDVLAQQQLLVSNPDSDAASSLGTQRQFSAASGNSPSAMNAKANTQQHLFATGDNSPSARSSSIQQHMCSPCRNSQSATNSPTEHQLFLPHDGGTSKRVISSAQRPPLSNPRMNAESATPSPSTIQFVPPHIGGHSEPSVNSNVPPHLSTRANSPSAEHSYASRQILALPHESVHSESASSSSQQKLSPTTFPHGNLNMGIVSLSSRVWQEGEKGSSAPFLEENNAGGSSQSASFMRSVEPEHYLSAIYTSLPLQKENGHGDRDDDSVTSHNKEASCNSVSNSHMMIPTTSLPPITNADSAIPWPACGATPPCLTTATVPSCARSPHTPIGRANAHEFLVEKATPLCAHDAVNAHLLDNTTIAAYAFLGWRVAWRLHRACVRTHLHAWHHATKCVRYMRAARVFAAWQRVLADARSEREAMTAHHYASSCALHAFTRWIRFANEARQEQHVLEREAATRYSRVRCRECFRSWRRAADELKGITALHHAPALCRRTVRKWHQYCVCLYANATAHHVHALLRVAFTAWRRGLAVILTYIDKHAAHACMRTMFARWLDAVWEPRFIVASQHHARACSRRYFSHWHQVTIAGTLDKQQAHLAEQHFALTLLCSSMDCWQKYARECAHVRACADKILLLRARGYIRHWHVRSRRQARGHACAVRIAAQRLTRQKRSALQRWWQRLLVERDVAQVQERTSLRARARMMGAWCGWVSDRKAWRNYVTICAERITDRRRAVAIRAWSAYAHNERSARAIALQRTLLRLRAHLNAWSMHYRVQYAVRRHIRRTATVCVASWCLYVAFVRMRRTNAQQYRRSLATRCMSAWARVATLAPYLRALRTRRYHAWLRNCLAAWHNSAICVGRQHHALARALWASRIWEYWRVFVVLQQLLRLSLQQWRATTSSAAYERRLTQSSAYYATSLQRKVFASYRIVRRTRAAAMDRLHATMNPIARFHTGANAFLAWRAYVRVTCRRDKMSLRVHLYTWRAHYRDQLGHHVLNNGRWSMMRLRRLLDVWRAACIDAGARHVRIARWGAVVASTWHVQQRVRVQTCFQALVASRLRSERAIGFRRAQLLHRAQHGLHLLRSRINMRRRACHLSLRHKFLRFCCAVRVQRANMALDQRADRLRSRHLLRRFFRATRIARAVRAEEAVLARKADGMRTRRMFARFCRAVSMARQDTMRVYAKMRARQLLREWRRVLWVHKRNMEHFEKRRQERFALHRIREIERRIAVVEFCRRRQTLMLHCLFRAWHRTHHQLLRLTTLANTARRTRRHHVLRAWHHAHACLRVVHGLLATRSRAHLAHVFRAWQHVHARLRVVRGILAIRSRARLARFFCAWQQVHAYLVQRQRHLQSIDAKRHTRLSTYALLAWSHYCQVAQRGVICTTMITRHRARRVRVQCVRQWAYSTRMSELARKVETRRQRRIQGIVLAYWVKAIAVQRKVQIGQHDVLRVVAREWHVEASLQRRLGEWELCTVATRTQELLLWWRACTFQQRMMRHKAFHAFRKITLMRKRFLLNTVSYARLLAKADKFRHAKNHCALRRYTRAWRDVGHGRVRYAFAVERLQGILRKPLHHWRAVAHNYRVCNLFHLVVARQMWDQWLRGAHTTRVQQWVRMRDVQFTRTTMLRMIDSWHQLVRDRRHAVTQIATLLARARQRGAFHCLFVFAAWIDQIRPTHLLAGIFHAWRRGSQLNNSACRILWQWWRRYTAALKRVRKPRLRGVIRAFVEFKREKWNIRRKLEVAKAAFTRRVLWTAFLVWQCRVDFIRQSIDTQQNFGGFSPASNSVLSSRTHSNSALNARYASPASVSMPTHYFRTAMLVSSSPIKPLNFSPALHSPLGDSLILSSSMDVRRYELSSAEWPLEKIEDVTECATSNSEHAHSNDAKTNGSVTGVSARSVGECANSSIAGAHGSARGSPAPRTSERARSGSINTPGNGSGVPLRRMNDRSGSICCSGSRLSPSVPMTHDNSSSAKIYSSDSRFFVNHIRTSSASSSSPILGFFDSPAYIPRERLFTSSGDSVLVHRMEEVAPLNEVTSSRSDVLVSDSSDVRESIELLLGSTVKTRCDQILSWETLQTAGSNGKRRRVARARKTTWENKENVTDNAI